MSESVSSSRGRTSMPHAEQMARLSEQEVAKLTEGLDKLLAILTEKPAEIVDSESLRKGYLFGVWEKMQRVGKRPRTCVVPSCRNRSIPASHSLQRNGPLALIAERGHVMSPAFDLRTCRHSIARVGIGRASTFPGFCAKHERLFAELEARRELATDSDIRAQVFRTVCWQTVRKRQEVADLLSFLRVWQFLISVHGWKIVRETIGDEMVTRLRMKGLSTQGSTPLEQFLSSEAQAAASHVNELERVWLPASLREFEGKGDGLAHVALRIQQTLPVCLAGFGNYHVITSTGPKPIMAALNIWPHATGVTIVMSTELRFERELRDFFHSRVDRSVGPLELIETWMMNGTDHWFLRPSVWAAIPVARQQRILRHIGERGYDLGTPYHLSIFDEIRRAMLATKDPDLDEMLETRKLAP